jgi:hypothetical protein
MKNKKINRTELVELVKNTKGKFFTVTFTKLNGAERTINGNVKSNCLTNLGHIRIYSMKDKGYRNVNSRTIKSVSFQSINYIVK